MRGGGGNFKKFEFYRHAIDGSGIDIEDSSSPKNSLKCPLALLLTVSFFPKIIEKQGNRFFVTKSMT